MLWVELETKDIVTDVEELGDMTVLCLEKDPMVLAVAKDRKEDSEVLEPKEPLMGAAVIVAGVARTISETGSMIVTITSGSVGKDSCTLTAGYSRGDWAVVGTAVIEMSGAPTVVVMAVSGRVGSRETSTPFPVEVDMVVRSTGKASVLVAAVV